VRDLDTSHLDEWVELGRAIQDGDMGEAVEQMNTGAEANGVNPPEESLIWIGAIHGEQTLLHYAMLGKSTDVVQLLMANHGANPSDTTYGGITLSGLARFRKDFATAEVLRKAIADGKPLQ